jgi:hypothetical protein
VKKTLDEMAAYAGAETILEATVEELEQERQENASLRSQLEEKDKALAQAQGVVEEIAERACQAVMPALKGYRCQYTLDEDGHGIELVDMLCAPNTEDISTGKAERELLGDAICGAIMAEVAAYRRESCPTKEAPSC